MNPLPRAPLPFPAYYDHKRGIYLLDAEHGWTCFSKDDLKLHMKHAGWAVSKDGFGTLDYELMRIQIDNKIDYSGPVAGHSKGLKSMKGSRVLVTQSYTPLVPRAGSWTLVQTCVENLLDRIDPAQKPIFYSWCQVYLRSLAADIFMPGQAVIFVGPHNCGKSFLQNLLTILFGGRSANPWPYMSGATEFNSDLFGAEHMQAEDPAVNNLSDRLDFASRIKQFTVNESQPCHGKNRDIVTVEPRWRVTVSINDEPYNLRAIPPIDDSTSDKISIFRCAANSIPFSSPDVEAREKFRLAIIAELPAFAHFLLHEWKIPEALRSGRFGVTHYHHPEILAEINENSPEYSLLRMFDENGLFGSKTIWEGTIQDLIQFLLRCYDDEDAIWLGHHSKTLSLQMKSLAAKCPLRVHRKKTGGKKLFIVYKNNPGPG